MRFTHDEIVQKLIEMRDEREFTLEEAATCLVKAIAGNFPFGFHAMDAFLQVRNMSEHVFIEEQRACRVCGLPSDAEIGWYPPRRDGNIEQDAQKIGGQGMLLVYWQYTVALKPQQATSSEREFLHNLIEQITFADQLETAQGLRIRLTKSGYFQAGHYKDLDYHRFWDTINVLVNCGILPNDLIAPTYDSVQTRQMYLDAHKAAEKYIDDTTIMPACAWRGCNGVNMERFNEIFEKHIC